jgi:hypothetical protein
MRLLWEITYFLPSLVHLNYFCYVRACNNQGMQHLRTVKLIARFVLIWFALAIGVSIASPLVNPKSMDVICSGTDVSKWRSSNSIGTSPATSHTLDCPLCLGIGAPPPVAVWKFDPIQPSAFILQGIQSVHIAALAAAPLPARGPPSPL